MGIVHKARGTEIPNQAQRVFLSYNGRNVEDRDAIISDLHSNAEIDCVVSYLENPDEIDENELNDETSEAKVLVIWVTPEMLEATTSEKLPLEYYMAQKAATPIIPILRYDSIFETFNNAFGKIHCINKPYDDKFEDEQNKEYKMNLNVQLEKYLASEEMTKLINEKAFSGSIFVGYRKHEREEAIRFMKAFHDLEGCVSISIRYDNFLTAGRNFNKEIEEIISDKDTLALALVVTPDLATEHNYVQSTEYPLARKIEKLVIPVEVKETSYSQFIEYFPDAGTPICLEDTVSLQATIHGKLDKTTFVKKLDSERAYLLGMAYLKGINVERDFDRAVRLLSAAAEDWAESSIYAADQLANIYKNGTWTNINFGKALRWYKRALAIQEKVHGKEHLDTADTCNCIACIYDRQGKHPKALEWYQKALYICEKVLGKKHQDVAIINNNIAGIYDSLGEYPKALKGYQKALYICKKILGEKHLNIAAINSNIAGVYNSQGEYQKALKWHQKALAIREKLLGKGHPNTTHSYNNIACVYINQGCYSKALEWFEKDLIICEKALGKKHPDTATIYNNIAFVCEKQGKHSKALEWYNKVLAVREKVLGNKHPDTAATYNNIAGVYDSQGKHPKALEWYEKALVVREKVLGSEHPDTATTYNNIACAYVYQRKYLKALKWHRKALAIREAVLGKEHPDTALTYNNIAFLYIAQRDYLKAQEWHQKALGIREKVLGNEHLDTATTYNNIAFVYDAQGEYLKALEWYQKALVIREKMLGRDHSDTAATYNNIKNVYKKREVENRNIS